MSEGDVGGAVEATSEVSEGAVSESVGVPEGGDGVEVVGEAAPENGERMFTVKVDGQELQVSEADLIRDYQLAQASYKKMEEAAGLRKQSDEVRRNHQLVAEIMRNGTSAQKSQVLASYMGGEENLRRWLNDEVNSMIEFQQLSPEAQKLRKTEQELASYKERARRQQEYEQQQKLSHEQAQAEQYFLQQFTGALKDVGLPSNPATISRMASIASYYADKGQQVDSAKIAELVKKEVMADLNTMLDTDDQEKLLSIVGEKRVKGLSNHLASKINPTPPKTAPRVVGGRPKKQKQISSRDWFRQRELARRK
tara:strand:- start:46 stop:975 length:930 start_codon:yes stop_codon:yes gene_type:complete